MTTPNQVTKVVTEPVRLAFVHLFEPYAHNPDQDKMFSATLIIPKADKVTLRKIKEAQQTALAKKWPAKVPPGVKSTLRDGDTEIDLERYPEFAGCFYMNVRSKTQPGIVDRQVQPILDSTEVYSGCWARVSINAFAFDTSGNKGVSFGLNHVQKIKDGDFLGGRSRPEDDFTAEVLSGDDDFTSLVS